MGCDIHAYIEYNHPRLKEWRGFAKVDLGRDYEVFAAMAGVRGFYPVVEPRGFPEDADYTTKEEYEEWGYDGHTPSWLTTGEFAGAVARGKAETGYKATLAAMEAFEKDQIPARLVFWFDN